MANGVKISRVGTAAAFTSEDATLALGEEGYESDTGYRKIGDGSTSWTSLPYYNRGPIYKDAATWTSDNPTLPPGQIGFETDTKKTKVGDGTTAWASLDYEIQPAVIPSGMIMPAFIASAPTGWLLCDGSAVSRTTYADLFAEIGTDFGVGDGSTTFNLPDLQGMFLRGSGSHGSLTMGDGNAYAGPALGASENDQALAHRHNHVLNGADGAGSSSSNTSAAASSTPGKIQTGNGASYSQFWIGDMRSDGTHGLRAGDETRPVAYGVNYMIKT